MAYADHEQEFLEELAERWFVALQDRFLFVQRHRGENLAKSHQEIIATYETELNELFATADMYQAMRERLSDNVYPVLKQKGLVLNRGTKKFWLQVQKWLKEEIYPQWLQSQGVRLWDKLWQRGILTDKIYPEPYRIGTLKPSPTNPRKTSQMIVGTTFLYRVKESLQGYLLWLVRDGLGNICCLSPSYLAPHPLLEGRSPQVFPQPDSESPTLEIGEELGEEQVLVMTLPQRPDWAWLPDEMGEILQMEPPYLDEIFDQSQLAGVQLKKIRYEVIAQDSGGS